MRQISGAQRLYGLRAGFPERGGWWRPGLLGAPPPLGPGRRFLDIRFRLNP